MLDEFALILRLDDVYWLEEGRISIEMVSLAIGCLGLVLVGAEPFNFLKDDNGKITIESALLALAIVVPWFVVCVLKGKYRLTLFGLFVFPVSIFGAVRLARPASRWAKWRYKPKKMERAERRTARQDARAGTRSRPGSATSSPASRRARPPHRARSPGRDERRRPRAVRSTDRRVCGRTSRRGGKSVSRCS